MIEIIALTGGWLLGWLLGWLYFKADLDTAKRAEARVILASQQKLADFYDVVAMSHALTPKPGENHITVLPPEEVNPGDKWVLQTLSIQPTSHCPKGVPVTFVWDKPIPLVRKVVE